MSISQLKPQQLRQFMRSRHEREYLLLDVRQPEEYRSGHIPGAQLLPLPELMQSLDRLPSEKTLIFYCRSGGRSAAAAVMAQEELGGRAGLVNLSGGMLAWDGVSLTGFPQVDLFQGLAPAQMFQTAINLEKGAQLFYQAAAAAHPGEEMFERLIRAERAHAEVVYGFWQKLAADLGPFEELYKLQSGDILEGGIPLESALQELRSVQAEDKLLRWIETALRIEHAAYDLYRSMADRQEEPSSGQAFLSLAQAEKGHMELLISRLPVAR